MNFLAHLHLAHLADSSLPGNLMADFVRGNPQGDYPAEIIDGIYMHRRIDVMTDNLAEVTGAIVAMEGSSIVGDDITLFVNTDADLRAATITGVTSVVMDDDNRLYSGQGFGAGTATTGTAASLTLFDSQVSQLLSDGVVFSTQGETFGAQSLLTVVITNDVVLSDLIDMASWNDSIKLAFVVTDGATRDVDDAADGLVVGDE